MELKDIMTISGYSGLFKYVSKARNGIIVEGFEDKKRMNAFSHYKVSSLVDIAVFAESEEIPLRKIFKAISVAENGGQAIDSKSGDPELKEYFAKILPNYDRQKVYISDIRKMIGWYNILQRNGFNNFEDEPEVKKETHEDEETQELQEKPKKQKVQDTKIKKEKQVKPGGNKEKPKTSSTRANTRVKK